MGTKEFHKNTIDPKLSDYKSRKMQLARTCFRSLSQSDITSTTPGSSALHKKAMMEYCGIVFINLQRATKLQRKRNSSLITHTYIEFTMGSQAVKSKKWKNIKDPKWNEALQLNLPMQTDSCDLTITAHAHSAITNSTTDIGSSTINVREERFLDAPQVLELPLGEGTLYL